MLADFEKQIGAIYDWDNDKVWREIATAASAYLRECNAKIAKRCKELGIPKAFQPSITASWYGRNESAVLSRRVELRRMAKTQIDAVEHAAKVKIEMVSVQAQTEILSNAMSSPSAIEFLNSLPPIDALMPPLDFKLIEKLTGKSYESDAEDERKVVQLRLVQSDKEDKRAKPDDARDVAAADDTTVTDSSGDVAADLGVPPLRVDDPDFKEVTVRGEGLDDPPRDPGLMP